MKADKVDGFINVSFDGFLDQLKFRTAQRAKRDAGTHEIIPITDDDTEPLKPIIHQAASVVLGRAGIIAEDELMGYEKFKDVSIEDDEDDEDQILGYKVNDTTLEYGSAQWLLFHGIVYEVLRNWYESLGLYDESQYWMQRLNRIILDYRNRPGRFTNPDRTPNITL